MTIEIKPETEQLVNDEIRSGHFASIDDLIFKTVDAWRRRWGMEVGPPKPRKKLVDVLSSPPFSGSELNLERQIDYPRPIDL